MLRMNLFFLFLLSTSLLFGQNANLDKKVKVALYFDGACDSTFRLPVSAVRYSYDTSGKTMAAERYARACDTQRVLKFGSLSPYSTLAYQYDSLNRLSKEFFLTPEASGIFMENFKNINYDAQGNITSAMKIDRSFTVMAGDSFVYVYDKKNKIVGYKQYRPDLANGVWFLDREVSHVKYKDNKPKSFVLAERGFGGRFTSYQYRDLMWDNVDLVNQNYTYAVWDTMIGKSWIPLQKLETKVNGNQKSVLQYRNQAVLSKKTQWTLESEVSTSSSNSELPNVFEYEFSSEGKKVMVSGLIDSIHYNLDSSFAKRVVYKLEEKDGEKQFVKSYEILQLYKLPNAWNQTKVLALNPVKADFNLKAFFFKNPGIDSASLKIEVVDLDGKNLESPLVDYTEDNEYLTLVFKPSYHKAMLVRFYEKESLKFHAIVIAL